MHCVRCKRSRSRQTYEAQLERKRMVHNMCIDIDSIVTQLRLAYDLIKKIQT